MPPRANNKAGPPPGAKTGNELVRADLPSLTAALDARTDQFLSLLGSEAAVARFRTVAIHAVSSRPDLLSCDPLTIIEAIREAASLDLEPTGVLGEAWLIPYKGQVKLRIGWQGHLKLVRRAGGVTAVDCQVVYDRDEFALTLGTTPGIRHVPALGDRGGYRGAYAWAKLNSGDLIIEWLPMADIEPIKKLAASDSLMWTKFPGEGMRKSAVRRLQKRLPKSPLIEQALKLEAETEEYVPTEAPARNAAVAALASRFGEESTEEEPKNVTPTPEEAPAGMTEPQDGGQGEPPPTATPAPVPQGEEPPPKPVREAEPAPPPDDGVLRQCESQSPWTEGVQCRLPQGHHGIHRTDKESWD